MYREHTQRLRVLSALLDVCCISMAFALAFALRVAHESLPLLRRIPSTPWDPNQAVQSEYALVLAVSMLGWFLGLSFSNIDVYASKPALWQSVRPIIRASVWAFVATGVAVFALKMNSISRLFYGYYFLLGLAFLLAKRFMFASLVRRSRTSHGAHRHVLLVGSRLATGWFARVVLGAETAGYKLVGVLVSGGPPPVEAFDLTIMGSLGELDQVLERTPVDDVFIVGGATELAGLAPVAQRLILSGKVVSLVSAPAPILQGVHGRISDFAGVPVLSFGPMPPDAVGARLKRGMDLLTAAFALILAAPIMAAIVAAMKVLDPGPLLFNQERLGLNGGRFRIHKFRTMRVDAEGMLTKNPELYRKYVMNGFKLPEDEDPRTSTFGRFLRRTSLDELPQLWNVLKGEMSLVGPRPIVPAELSLYEPYAKMFLAVRPGITGRWQVDGRSSVPYPERAFLDLDYVGKHSLSSDFSILARTVPAVLRRKGAH